MRKGRPWPYRAADSVSFSPVAAPIAVGLDAYPSCDFCGLCRGQDILPTGDPAGADLLVGGGYADPVPEPVADRRLAEVVSAHLEAGADQVDGVIRKHGDEEVGSDLVVALVPDGAQTEFAI